MSGALFDLEPYGTPCLVCGELTCSCRAAGTLDATLSERWPVKDPRPCLCPSDCGCHPHNHRANVCGCRGHDSEQAPPAMRCCPCGNLVREPFTYCADPACLGYRPTSRRPDHASHGWML